MEHLAIATGGSLAEHDVVPYVATEDYLHVDFWDYLDTQWATDRPAWIREVSEEALQSTMQTWFFFAFLRKILGRFFVAEDFVVQRKLPDGSSQRVLSTVRLESTLLGWSNHAKEYMSRDEILVHCQRCFRPFRFDEFNVSWALSEPKTEIRHSRSIFTVAQFVGLFIIKVFEFPFQKFLLSHKPDFLPPEDLEIMRQNGWCPYDAERSWRGIDIETGMMLRTTIKPKLEDHKDCTTQRCHHAQIDPSKFALRHAEANCPCDPWLIDAQDLARAVESDALPCLAVKRGADGRIPTGSFETAEFELVIANGDVPYIAISHVWADGLGNPKQNALPKCRMLSLASKLERMSMGVMSEVWTDKAFFWLDTLCCPVGPPALKAKAISKLGEIYTGAAQVLVLDRCLQETTVKDRRHLDLAAYVHSSRWTQRCWTLQEGMLALRLWFRFADMDVRADEILLALSSHPLNNVVGQQAALDFARSIRSLIGGYLKDSPNGMRDSPGLHNITYVFSQRSLSYYSDEPFCLFVLIDEAKIAAEASQDFEANMALFWRACRRRRLINSDIIFNTLPKLAKKGYRWAPRSLLYANHKQHTGTIRAGFPTAYSSVKEFPEIRSISGDEVEMRGLAVRFDGMILQHSTTFSFKRQIKQHKLPDEEPWSPWMLLNDEKRQMWYIVNPGNETDDGRAIRESSLEDDMEMGIILSEELSDKGPTALGLIVSIVETGEDFRHVRGHGQVLVTYMGSEHREMLNRLLASPADTPDKITPELFALGNAAMREQHFPQYMLDEADGGRVKTYIKRTSQRFMRGQYLRMAEHVGEQHGVWIVE